MKLESTESTLKTGELITIREATREDAANFINFLKDNLNTTKFIPLYPDEFKKTIEEVMDWLQSFNDNNYGILLLAEFDGLIIGNINLDEHPREMLKHTGSIGMSILAHWRNKGIGALLLESVFNWAKSTKQLELLWLQVFGTNTSAIKLYQKMGFQETGRQVNFFKNRIGEYEDSVTMTKMI